MAQTDLNMAKKFDHAHYPIQLMPTIHTSTYVHYLYIILATWKFDLWVQSQQGIWFLLAYLFILQFLAYFALTAIHP